MKKLFCLLLALSLFLPVVICAEEAQDSRNNLVLPADFPGVYFGANRDTAIKTFDTYWRQFSQYASEPVEDNTTLADGTPITVLTFRSENVTTEDSLKRPLTAKLYFRNGMLIAAAQVTEIPEGFDASNGKSYIENALKAGKAGLLRMEEIGINAELLGVAARLEEGQEMWRYTFANGEKTIGAIITMRAVDGVLYMAEFMAGKDEEQAQAKQITLSLADLKGYSELSSEQQIAVRTYAQYMLQQQKKTIEEYIEFVKNNSNP